MLGQGIVNLFGNLADGENDGLMSQRIILLELEFTLFYTKREKVWVVPGAGQTPEGM